MSKNIGSSHVDTDCDVKGENCACFMYENGNYIGCGDVFMNHGVFEAINFAFNNPELLSIDKTSETYREISRARWRMTCEGHFQRDGT